MSQYMERLDELYEELQALEDDIATEMGNGDYVDDFHHSHTILSIVTKMLEVYEETPL